MFLIRGVSTTLLCEPTSITDSISFADNDGKLLGSLTILQQRCRKIFDRGRLCRRDGFEFAHRLLMRDSQTRPEHFWDRDPVCTNFYFSSAMTAGLRSMLPLETVVSGAACQEIDKGGSRLLQRNGVKIAKSAVFAAPLRNGRKRLQIVPGSQLVAVNPAAVP